MDKHHGIVFQDMTGVYNVTQLYTINERTSCTVSKLHVFFLHSCSAFSNMISPNFSHLPD